MRRRGRTRKTSARNVTSAPMDRVCWGTKISSRSELVRRLSENVVYLLTWLFPKGKRMCPGEPLTRNSYFLFTAALVKTFEFSALSNKCPPTLEPIAGFTLAYDGFEAVVRCRHQKQVWSSQLTVSHRFGGLHTFFKQCNSHQTIQHYF